MMTPFVSVFSAMIVDLKEDYKKFKINQKKYIQYFEKNKKIAKQTNFILIKNLLCDYQAELEIYKENLNEIIDSYSN
jgi:hypothetical protein